jgi:hypothetical protein
MQALAAAVQAFRMEHSVDVVDFGHRRLESSLGCRHEVTRGRDAILERHEFKAQSWLPRRRRHAGEGGPHEWIGALSKRPPEGEVEAVGAS